jgi:hypothetical protein
MITSVKELEITNILGQKVFHEKTPLNSNTIPIDIRAFSNGLYNIRITDNAKTMNTKFIVAR